MLRNVIIGVCMSFRDWNANYKLAAGLAGALVLWMVSGVFSGKRNDSAAKDHEIAPSFAVQVTRSDASEYRRSIFVRGRSEANRSVLVMAEIDGQVIATPAREGAVVTKGEALCVLDSQDRLLRLEQARAQRDKAQIDYEGALKLRDGGFQSRTQIAAAKANLAVAEAELKTSTLASEKLTIRAPFAGVVQERLIEVGGFVQRASPCVRLLELSPLVVSGQVPETDLAAMSPGNEAKVVFLDGKTYSGRLSYVSRAADTVTRTFRIEVEIGNESLELADGLSADLQIYTKRFKAHLINPSLLALMSDGNIGIKILDADNKVDFVPVELLGDDQQGVWVSGLPDGVTIITVGQEYVAPGSIVTVADSAEESGSAVSLGGSL